MPFDKLNDDVTRPVLRENATSTNLSVTHASLSLVLHTLRKENDISFANILATRIRNTLVCRFARPEDDKKTVLILITKSWNSRRGFERSAVT